MRISTKKDSKKVTIRPQTKRMSQAIESSGKNAVKKITLVKSEKNIIDENEIERDYISQI